MPATGLWWRRLSQLGRITDEPGRLTRTFLSPAMRRANRLVAQWMREAGLAVREDAVGNVIGRTQSAVPNASTLLLGSHLDTVCDAGRFDGALGVLLPIAALGELRRRGVRLPFAVEVIGFSEEEGVRFSSAYLGSKGYSGQLRAADLNRRDGQGVTVQEAIRQWSSSRAVSSAPKTSLPKRVRHPALPGKRVHAGDGMLGYCEVHIEQGPVLEQERLAVGVVSAIAGQTRVRVAFRGVAGHAGTTPMPLRRDALAGAAEFIGFAESLARVTTSLVTTVGTIFVTPAAPNVIPGEAVISLDVRHPRDASRRDALALLRAGAKAIAERRRLTLTWQATQDDGAVACSAQLTAVLDASVQAVQRRCVSLVSGAGHDAVVMSAMGPVAMLFVRCRGGISHHPNEYVSRADVGMALRVLMDFLPRLAAATKTEL